MALGQDDIHVLALVKGEERYVILYTAETRASALNQLGRWAANKELAFSWTDACVCSMRIRQLAEK